VSRRDLPPFWRDLTTLAIGAGGFGLTIWRDPGPWTVPILLVCAAMMGGVGVLRLYLTPPRTPDDGSSPAPDSPEPPPRSPLPSAAPSAGES